MTTASANDESIAKPIYEVIHGLRAKCAIAATAATAAATAEAAARAHFRVC
jgi:hypothetical protein